MSISRNRTLSDALTHYNTIVKPNSTTGVYHYNYKKAFDLFEKLPDNLPDKHYYLFECYLHGRGVHADIHIANEHLKTACELNHPLAFLRKAHLLEHEIRGKTYTKSNVSKITDLYKLAIKYSTNTKFEVYVQFNFLLYMIDTYNNLKSSQDKSTYKKGIFDLAYSLAAEYKYPPAYYVFAEILNGNSKIEGIVDETYKQKNSTYTIHEIIINNYLLAAQGGELQAAKRLADYYFSLPDYDEMTWWYWWAKYNDKKYNNITIQNKILKDDILRKNFKKMSEDVEKKMSKETTARRVKDEQKKEMFIDEVDKRKCKMLKSRRT